jgi:hypothetical protein
MPTFIDFHSLGKFTEDELKKVQEMPRDEYGVKTLNTFYDIESGVMFCLVDSPDRDSVEKHHSKFGITCGWITQVKMTAEYNDTRAEGT